MSIIFTDGSVLECNTIEICGSKLYVDGYRVVDMYDIDSIEGWAENLKISIDTDNNVCYNVCAS